MCVVTSAITRPLITASDASGAGGMCSRERRGHMSMLESRRIKWDKRAGNIAAAGCGCTPSGNGSSSPERLFFRSVRDISGITVKIKGFS